MTFFRQINIFNNEIITNGKINNIFVKEKTMTQQLKKPSHSACVKKANNKNNNYNTNRKKHPSVQCRQHEHFYQISYKEFLP